MRLTRVKRYVAAAAAASLLLAACGGDDDAGDTAAPGDADTNGEVDETETDDVDTSDIDIQGDTASEIYAQLAELDPDVRDQYILERAIEEGEVMLYLAQPVEWGEEWQRRFNETYPEINMQFVRGSHGDLLERFPAEERSGNHTADVLQPGGVNIPAFADQGLLADMHGVPVPDYYPDEVVGDWWVTTAAGPFVITWNTNLVSEDEAPQNHQDLLDERWHGQVAIEAEPEAWIVGLIEAWGLEETEAYLRELVIEREAPIRSGHTNTMQLLAAGEFAIASELFVHHVEGLIDEGAPLDWTTGGVVPVSSTDMGISENAPNPFAAALLMNFLLSDEGVAVWYDEGRPVNHPEADYKFPRIQELAQSGEMVLADPPDQIELGQQARQLIEEIITPRFTE